MGLGEIVAIKSESTRVADVVAASPFDLPVPSCPGWGLGDLARHLGRVQRFWAANLVARNPSGPQRGEPSAPASAGLTSDWLKASTDLLGTALEASADGDPCWTWWGEPLTAWAVGRHQVQEASVHRWDAELAVGRPEPLKTAVAVDGVSEFLEVVDPGAATRSGRVDLVAVDTGRKWVLGSGPGVPVTARATASELVLLLYGRLTTAEVEIEGQSALFDAFFAGAAP
jgi:uncharacterized protein (TIGR03083 family)